MPVYVRAIAKLGPLPVAPALSGCTRAEVGFVPCRRSSMADTEETAHRRAQGQKQPHCRQRLGAAGEPVPRLGAAPARGRRSCTSRLLNRGGHRAGANRRAARCTQKTGVTAARLPPERTEPGNRVLAPPARDDEADARKQQRRAAANCTSCPSHGQRSGAAPTTACPREEARR